MSAGGTIIDAMITGKLGEALGSVEETIAATRGASYAKSAIIRLRASVLTSNRDKLLKPLLWLGVACRTQGVPLSTLLCECGRNLSWFRSRFPQPAGEYLKVSIADVELGLKFTLIPFLSRLGLLVAEVIGFDKLDVRIQQALDASGRSDVSEAERALCRDVAHALSGDIPDKPDLRRFWAIQKYLGETKAAPFSREEVSDEDVLGFWRMRAPTGGDIDVKRHSTCVEAFSRLLQLWAVGEASALGRDALDVDALRDTSASTSQFMNEGTDEPGSLYVDADQRMMMQCALGLLCEAPEDSILAFLEAIKASPLNMVVAVGADLLGSISAYPAGAENLHRSRARNRVFDPIQTAVAKLSAKAGSVQEVRERATQLPTETYVKLITDARKAVTAIENALWGCVHILAMNRRPDCVELMLELADETLLTSLRTQFGGRASPSMLIEALRETIEEGAPHPAISIFLNRAASSHKKTERNGFFADQLHDPRIVEAANAMADLPAGAFSRICSRLSRLEAEIAPRSSQYRFEEDFEFFSQFLVELYAKGENHA